jgi:hypothetical protein
MLNATGGSWWQRLRRWAPTTKLEAARQLCIPLGGVNRREIQSDDVKKQLQLMLKVRCGIDFI